jgi:hypothetical protein
MEAQLNSVPSWCDTVTGRPPETPAGPPRPVCPVRSSSLNDPHKSGGKLHCYVNLSETVKNDLRTEVIALPVSINQIKIIKKSWAQHQPIRARRRAYPCHRCPGSATTGSVPRRAGVEREREVPHSRRGRQRLRVRSGAARPEEGAAWSARSEWRKRSENEKP